MTNGRRGSSAGLVLAALASSLCAGLSAVTARAAAQDPPGPPAPPAEAQPAPSPRTLVAQGKIEAALEAWRALARQRPEDAEPRRELVQLLLDQGLVDDALDECLSALRAFPKNVDLLQRMAIACQRKAESVSGQTGRGGSPAMWLEDAVRYATDAKTLAPHLREPRLVLGMALFGLGRLEEARAEADELCQKFADHPGGHVLRGEVLFDDYQRGRQDGSLVAPKRAELVAQIRAAFGRAIELDPQRVVPHRRLGDLGGWEGELPKAFDHYAEAMARDPARGAPLAWLEENASDKDRRAVFARALARFEALGTEPRAAAADLHWQIGLLDYRAQRWPDSRKHMQACYTLRPDYLNAIYYFALAAFHGGDRDAALIGFVLLAQKSPQTLAEALRSSGESATTNAGIVSHFAAEALKRGNGPASRDLNHALALFDDSPATWNNYAFLCRELGQPEESLKGYQRALEVAPEDPQLLNDCAVILQYNLKRDLDQARAMYEKAIANAQRLLADKKIGTDDQARYRQALQDARGNLAKLR